MKSRTEAQRKSDRAKLARLSLAKLRSRQRQIEALQKENFAAYQQAPKQDATQRRMLEDKADDLDEMLKDVEAAIRSVAFKPSAKH